MPLTFPLKFPLTWPSPNHTTGWDILLSMYLDVKYQSPVQRTVCPNDGWALEDTERGLFCPFCSWTPGIPPRFIPRNPDNTSA